MSKSKSSAKKVDKKTAKKSDKLDSTVIMLDNFADKSVVAFVDNMFAKIVAKISDNQVLSAMQAFFTILVAMRHEFEDFRNKADAINQLNSKLRKSLHCYVDACLSKAQDDRLNFSDQLQKSYNTSQHYKAVDKAFEKTEEFAKFVEIQKTRTLQSFLNITNAKIKLDKNAKKQLQSFKLCQAFIDYCDNHESAKILEKFAFAKTK